VTAKELFIVGLRLLGIYFAVAAIPAALSLDYFGACPGVAGLILLTRADLIANLCYPRDARKDDRLERVPRDFRDV